MVQISPFNWLEGSLAYCWATDMTQQSWKALKWKSWKGWQPKGRPAKNNQDLETTRRSYATRRLKIVMNHFNQCYFTVSKVCKVTLEMIGCVIEKRTPRHVHFFAWLTNWILIWFGAIFKQLFKHDFQFKFFLW